MVVEKRQTFINQATKYFRQGKIDAAIKEYQKVLELKPDDLEIRRIVGDLELRQNNINAAVKQFEWISDYYLKEGFFAKAIAMYNKITRVDPEYERAFLKLAELYTKQGLVIEAKQIFLDLADKYKRGNNQKKALDMYKKILEFDRNNIKMRLLLADNYFKEGLQENAISEYLIAADILISKKEFERAEELLNGTISKTKELKVIQKLVQCYTSQGKDDKAVELLKGLGSELFKNVELLKMLGELYFKKGQINEAEIVFVRIAELKPEEGEVVMKLGKVYLQREEYDRAYKLFLPVVDRHIMNTKFDEAENLLRFIIASNNTYLPALKKLATIFEVTGKTSNLIAMYESLIPIYEQKNMRDELIAVLEKLIKLSDSPFNYEEQLAALVGKEEEKKKGEQQDEREIEVVNYSLKLASDAVRGRDFDKAIDTLKNVKSKFPQNLKVRVKLFEIYQTLNEIDMVVEEGKELLIQYQSKDMNDEYTDLLERLSALRPEDDKLVEMSGEERTNIDIDFDRGELAEQMQELSDSHIHGTDVMAGFDSDSDIVVLSDAQNLTDSRKKVDKSGSKSLSSLLSELDFYINDGYFGDAKDLIEKLKQRYPDNNNLVQRIEKFERARKKAEADIGRKPQAGARPPVGDTDTGTGEEPLMLGTDMTAGDFEDIENLDFSLGPDMPLEKEEITHNLGRVDRKTADPDRSEMPFPDDISEIESSIADESQMVQEQEDSKVGIQVNLDLEAPVKSAGAARLIAENPFENNLEIEMEEPADTDHISIPVVDRETLIQAPSVGFKELADEEFLSSSGDFFDFDNIIADEVGGGDSESPFKDIEQAEIAIEEEEDLLAGEGGFIEDEAYFEIEKKVFAEIEAFTFWIKELEKQRTSTIEKNMMEIFDEFKRGIEEKIGKEDYDTRYNLGIAYKEMGLVDEAIHEFLIAVKHPAKFFDSAGLLGMCFREKGIFNEAMSWYYKALSAPSRSEEEFLAIKYELIITMRLMGNLLGARKMMEEIMQVAPDFRDIPELYRELQALPQRSTR